MIKHLEVLSEQFSTSTTPSHLGFGSRTSGNRTLFNPQCLLKTSLNCYGLNTNVLSRPTILPTLLMVWSSTNSLSFILQCIISILNSTPFTFTGIVSRYYGGLKVESTDLQTYKYIWRSGDFTGISGTSTKKFSGL